MKGIASQFVLFFFLSLLLWIGVTYMSQNMKYCGAKEYYEMVRKQIEDSYFEQTVIENCVTKAKKQGYQLSVQCYGESRKDARVTLQYEYVFPIIQEKRCYMIDGYAR